MYSTEKAIKSKIYILQAFFFNPYHSRRQRILSGDAGRPNMHLGVALLTPGAILPKFRIQRFFSNVIELFSYCVIQDNENIKKTEKLFLIYIKTIEKTITAALS